MALFMKQDFSPPILSRRWLAIKFRPNVLIYSRDHIISILESGLLFREDSVEVEQEAPDAQIVWRRAGGCKGGWFTTGERNMAVLATLALVCAAPPRNLQRFTLLRMATYALVPIAIRATHRTYCRGSLRTLLCLMRDYMALVRRAMACCREYATLHAQLGSLATTIESMQAMLLQQQSSLLLVMSRAGSSLLGNVPWLRGDVIGTCDSDNVTKVHHAFLVVQSTLLKNIALAHSIPTAHTLKLYKNHNERLYWIHNILINHLVIEFKENYEALERMYRLLKNFGTKDNENTQKKLGSAINDSWLYSDVHTGIARSCLEMKVALEKCSHLDMFLDTCALNKQDINLEVLDKDIDDIIDNITKCLTTVQNSQIRLKKMQNKLKIDEDEAVEEDKEYEEKSVLQIEDKEPEIRDEVFYFVKTEDEPEISAAGDIVTGPGKKEKETSKIVLNELRRKLVKREDLMRERERQALAKTMPGLKNIPEFPRQINYEEYLVKKGFISKINRKTKPKKIFTKYNISKRRKSKLDDFKLRIQKYETENDLPKDYYEANAKLKVKSRFLTFKTTKSHIIITQWHKVSEPSKYESDLSDFSDTLSDIENRIQISNPPNELNRHKDNFKEFKVSKKDLELSPSSSESEFDVNQRAALLKDVRKHRVIRKKNYPKRNIDNVDGRNYPKRDIDNVDESLKPIEYNFGTGLAMASVLQSRMPNMCQEEVFIGNGEVSTDSGNDEDA